MSWPPFHTLDLIAHDLLPAGWEAEVLALTDRPDKHVLMTGERREPDESPWSFAVVTGPVLRDRLPWLWSLYHGALRDFSSASIGYPLLASERLQSTTTLNILEGKGAFTDWHRDRNTVSGVLFATVPPTGGDLVFRDDTGREARLTPRPGLFTCFEGTVEHQVTMLDAPGMRLSLPMVYYGADVEQPPAYGDDVYRLDAPETIGFASGI